MAYLDQEDLDEIEKVIHGTLRKPLDHVLDNRWDQLPARDEVFAKMDEMIALIKTTHEEMRQANLQLDSK